MVDIIGGNVQRRRQIRIKQIKEILTLKRKEGYDSNKLGRMVILMNVHSTTCYHIFFIVKTA